MNRDKTMKESGVTGRTERGEREVGGKEGVGVKQNMNAT